MSRIAIPASIAAAPAASQPLLEAVNKQIGSVPNLFRLVANSPAALEGYLGMNGALAKGQLPAMKELNQLPLDPPPFTGKPEQVAAGADKFARYCSVCHGDAALPGTINPDLRRSQYINAAEGIRAVVIDGVLMHGDNPKGMVSFKSALSADDVENIRQYLIKRANEDKALGDK